MTAFARSKYSPERAVRSRSRARSRSISALTRSRSMCSAAGRTADMRKHLLQVTVIDGTGGAAAVFAIVPPPLANPGAVIPPLQAEWADAWPRRPGLAAVPATVCAAAGSRVRDPAERVGGVGGWRTAVGEPPAGRLRRAPAGAARDRALRVAARDRRRARR